MLVGPLPATLQIETVLAAALGVAAAQSVERAPEASRAGDATLTIDAGAVTGRADVAHALLDFITSVPAQKMLRDAGIGVTR